MNPAPKFLTSHKMKKKITLIIIGLVIAATTWQIHSFSQVISPNIDKCSVDVDGVKIPNQCCIAYNDGMDALEKNWSNNLEQLMKQEKSSSAMVDEAFENIRTYQCWLSYLCKAVLFSGTKSPKTVEGTGIRSVHVGTVPGCQDIEDISLGNEWNEYSDIQRSIPIYSAFYDLTVDNKFTFMPACMTDINNEQPNFSLAQRNFDQCMTEMNRRFACNDSDTGQDCVNRSLSLVQIEKALRENSADQKAKALENKMGSIMPKMHAMETHLDYLKQKISLLDQRYACYPKYCD